MFKIGFEDRKYDLHRPNGCTVVTIEVEGWPGNEFGLWLPETIYHDGQIVWCNWVGDAHEDFQKEGAGFRWSKKLTDFEITSTLIPDPELSCIWYENSFRNTTDKPLHKLSSQNCFHMANAPEFISIRSERIWASIDGRWITTDKTPRHKSPDPRRVSFARKDLNPERKLITSTAFPSAQLEEEATHPLIMVEGFRGIGTVGVAARNFGHIFNNNDPILRCLHSEGQPIATLNPGETAKQRAVLIFSKGNHEAVLEHFEKNLKPKLG